MQPFGFRAPFCIRTETAYGKKRWAQFAAAALKLLQQATVVSSRLVEEETERKAEGWGAKW